MAHKRKRVGLCFIFTIEDEAAVRRQSVALDFWAAFDRAAKGVQKRKRSEDKKKRLVEWLNANRQKS